MTNFELIQHPQIAGLSIFLDTVDYRTPHFHPEWELIWPLSALEVDCGQESCRVAPGELFLLSPNTMHEYRTAGESCTFLCVQVGRKLFSAAFPAMERIAVEDFFPGRYLSESALDALRTRILQMAEAYFGRAANYELFCMGQINLILYELFRAMPTRVLTSEEIMLREKRNARLTRLLDFVDRNYMHKIRLSDFAQQEGRSLNYMSGFVHEALHQSFQSYVDTVRFHCACRLIAAGGMKMLEICELSGYSDYRYFSRAFRRRLGMTPEEYSRQRQTPVQESAAVHHSIHSLERIHSGEESLLLLREFQKQRSSEESAFAR